MPRLICYLSLLLTACSPRCGKEAPEPPAQFLPPEAFLLPEAFFTEEEAPRPGKPEADSKTIQPLLREPPAEELYALGIQPPAEHQAVSQAFHEALERLPGANLNTLSVTLHRLAAAHPWHALAEPASYAAIAAWHALGNCEEALEAGMAFVQAWPQGPYVAEVWLKMALCKKQSGNMAEFEETLEFVSRRYPRTPAGLKAKVELGLHPSINELK